MSESGKRSFWKDWFNQLPSAAAISDIPIKASGVKCGFNQTRKDFLSQSQKPFLPPLFSFQRLDSVGGKETDTDTICSQQSNSMGNYLQSAYPKRNAPYTQKLKLAFASYFSQLGKVQCQNMTNDKYHSLLPHYLCCNPLSRLQDQTFSSFRPFCSVIKVSHNSKFVSFDSTSTVHCNNSHDDKFNKDKSFLQPAMQSVDIPSSPLCIPDDFEQQPISPCTNQKQKSSCQVTTGGTVDVSINSTETFFHGNEKYSFQPSSSFEDEAFHETNEDDAPIPDQQSSILSDFILKQSDSSLSSSESNDDENSDGFESDVEDTLSDNSFDETDTDDDDFDIWKSAQSISDDEPDIATADTDNPLCHWDRLGCCRTPWTSYRKKKQEIDNNDGTLETCIKIEERKPSKDENTFYNASNSLEELCKESNTLTCELSGDGRSIARPICENNAIAYILGCSLENGYESDDEDNLSWTSDSANATEKSTSRDNWTLHYGAEDSAVETSSNNSCPLWDFFLSNQGPFADIFPFSSKPAEESNSKPPAAHSNDSDSESLPYKAPTKVRFSDQVTVHCLVAWSFAYRQARKGPWDQIARDRVRFASRISAVEKNIAWCLHPQHREKVKDLYH